MLLAKDQRKGRISRRTLPDYSHQRNEVTSAQPAGERSARNHPAERDGYTGGARSAPSPQGTVAAATGVARYRFKRRLPPAQPLPRPPPPHCTSHTVRSAPNPTPVSAPQHTFCALRARLGAV